MKKTRKKTKADSFRKFIISKTGTTIMFTIMGIMVFQGLLFNALSGNWEETTDYLVLAFFVGALIMANRTIRSGMRLINLQQKLITELHRAFTQSTEKVKEQQGTINKISGHLAQAKGELNKINGEPKKDEGSSN